MSIFNKCTKNDLKEYINICSSLVDIDINLAYDLAINAIKYYRGDSSLRDSLRLFQVLENRWYQSLENNNPDYSVYDDKYFLFDLWACWVIYSRKYLLSLKSDKSLADKDSHGNYYHLKSIAEDIGVINNIIDLGNGFGYTSAGLKELFSSANVYGTNIEGSYQYKIASNFGKIYDFSLIPDIHYLDKKIDLIFASEYFEHIENVTEHLEDIINACNPSCFIIANAFNTKSVGHFDKYIYKGRYYDAKITRLMFSQTLKKYGYLKVNTKCWNDRPSYWKREEKSKRGIFNR